MMDTDLRSCEIAVIGAGPAGLMAAETAAAAGLSVQVFDAMPSVGRKFLLAGRGGLNLTHSEPLAAFMARYGDRQQALTPWLRDFGPEDLRAWADALGAQTVGQLTDLGEQLPVAHLPRLSAF